MWRADEHLRWPLRGSSWLRACDRIWWHVEFVLCNVEPCSATHTGIGYRRWCCNARIDRVSLVKSPALMQGWPGLIVIAATAASADWMFVPCQRRRYGVDHDGPRGSSSSWSRSPCARSLCFTARNFQHLPQGIHTWRRWRTTGSDMRGPIAALETALIDDGRTRATPELNRHRFESHVVHRASRLTPAEPHYDLPRRVSANFTQARRQPLLPRPHTPARSIRQQRPFLLRFCQRRSRDHQRPHLSRWHPPSPVRTTGS